MEAIVHAKITNLCSIKYRPFGHSVWSPSQKCYMERLESVVISDLSFTDSEFLHFMLSVRAWGMSMCDI